MKLDALLLLLLSSFCLRQTTTTALEDDSDDDDDDDVISDVTQGNISSPAEAPKLSRASNGLGLSLYKSIVGGGKLENVLLSPVSISAVMSMVYLGARGETRKQMTSALHLEQFSSDKELNLAARDLRSNLNKQTTGRSTLRLANRLYTSKRYTVNEAFVADTQSYYSAELIPVDFSGDAETARKAINDWVEQETERKIRDLLPAGSVDKDSALVLVSAIYFQGFWANKFNAKLTKTQPFHVTSSETVNTRMMSVYSKKFRVVNVEQLDGKVLEMPYGVGNIAMYVFLPNAADGLKRLESGLSTAGVLEEAISQAGKAALKSVDVQFPRFQLELSTDLKQVLQSVGVESLFQQSADLSGIASNLYITDAVHKAFIKVDEAGSEAAAATAAIATSRSAMIEIKTRFIANHPFIFTIVDKASTTVLFMGRLVRPPTETSE